ncbi:vWA domain-containing protein [Asanoa sp. NPDC049518]|uniref:vWA domain-containing protein n=1 Tax=unclassified Asanoa TaxID=2685164 RepID=UPI0034306386
MPDPRAHLDAGGLHPGDPAWQAWSDAWTRHIPRLTGRHDLTVVVAPGAAGDAPETFYPDHRRIEIDATYIADNPDVTNPRRAGHKHVVPTGYGLLVHAAAHATHSRWRPPPATAPILAHVAALLEESRAEYRQRGRRRGDRRWLRHTVTTLINPNDAPVDDAWHAGQLAALLLARVDARVLTARDVREARAAVTTILGKQRLRRLRDIWRQAQATDDTDAARMVELARQWCDTLGIDPAITTDAPTADPGLFPGRLAAAITAYLAATAGVTVAEYVRRDLVHRHRAPRDWPRDRPTDAQRAAARRLGARLRQARTRPPEPSSRPSVIPPGRLRTRHAITADAQAAAGVTPTAAPWQQRAALPPENPPLRLAILVDLSGSMRTYAEPMSTAAWIFAHGAHHADATTTTIAFGDQVTILTPPGTRPAEILQMQAGGGTYTFPEAVKVADQLLDLRHARSRRMLAVVSDGDLKDKPAAQQLITTLDRNGCGVLWLRPDGPGHTFTDTTTITVTDPVDAIDQITRAAEAALAGP